MQLMKPRKPTDSDADSKALAVHDDRLAELDRRADEFRAQLAQLDLQRLRADTSNLERTVDAAVERGRARHRLTLALEVLADERAAVRRDRDVLAGQADRRRKERELGQIERELNAAMAKAVAAFGDLERDVAAIGDLAQRAHALGVGPVDTRMGSLRRAVDAVRQDWAFAAPAEVRLGLPVTAEEAARGELQRRLHDCREQVAQRLAEREAFARAVEERNQTVHPVPAPVALDYLGELSAAIRRGEALEERLAAELAAMDGGGGAPTDTPALPPPAPAVAAPKRQQPQPTARELAMAARFAAE
jgi:hypothetical protein